MKTSCSNEIKKAFDNLRDSNPGEKLAYDQNLDVKKRYSYINKNDKYIYIETPVDTNNFKVCNITYISSQILPILILHVFDKNHIGGSRNGKKEFILHGKIKEDLKDEIINGSELDFNSLPESMIIVIHNDDPAKDPDEKGGGIIVEGP